MELETINKLYLELSQIATAKTERELRMEAEINGLRKAMLKSSLQSDAAMQQLKGLVESTDGVMITKREGPVYRVRATASTADAEYASVGVTVEHALSKLESHARALRLCYEPKIESKIKNKKGKMNE